MDGEDGEAGIVSKTELSVRDRTRSTSLKDGKPFYRFLRKILKSEMATSGFDS